MELGEVELKLYLAPMEGVVDWVLRDMLTAIGGIDRCVSEFIRVCGTLLPDRVFLRAIPELNHGGRTPAGVAVRAQLLGSDPNSRKHCLIYPPREAALVKVSLWGQRLLWPLAME